MARVYDVFTNMDEDTLSEVAYAVMEKWIAFALGKTEINGRRIKDPTGKYASSIRLEGRGVNQIAVIADAPEAEYLEEGHVSVDLKTRLDPGRAYPMHRGTGNMPFVFNQSFNAKKRNIWAIPRSGGFNGFAFTPTDATKNPDSWVIPAMPAWNIAQHLKDLVETGEIFNA